MNEEAVEPQAEPIEQIVEEAMPQEDAQEGNETEQPQGKMIPLSVAQKLREKKRELELELQFERQERQRLLAERNAPPKPVEEDNSRYDTATKADVREEVKMSQEEAFRAFEEKLWIKQNPEKYEMVNENLPKFLKQRPNLASAINMASNRYEEAFTLMEALSPRERKEMRAAPTTVKKKDAPNAPGGVPKAGALNEAVDVMNMNDTEFRAWMNSKRKQR